MGSADWEHRWSYIRCWDACSILENSGLSRDYSLKPILKVQDSQEIFEPYSSNNRLTYYNQETYQVVSCRTGLIFEDIGRICHGVTLNFSGENVIISTSLKFMAIGVALATARTIAVLYFFSFARWTTQGVLRPRWNIYVLDGGASMHDYMEILRIL